MNNVLAIPLATAIAALALIPVSAAPALGDERGRCESKNHDSSKISVQAYLDHPSDSWPWHAAYVRTAPQWDACRSNYVATNVVDVYISTFADKYSSKQQAWKKCSQHSNGWRGDNPGFGGWYFTAVWNGTWWKGQGSCQWPTKSVRTRGFGKAQWKDGHIRTQWTYAGAHGRI